MEGKLFGGIVKSVLQYGVLEEAMWKNFMSQETDYTPFTTFYSDLSVAECAGEKGIRETHATVMKSWMHDYKYMTEYIMCLNHKIWEWYDEKYENRQIRLLYDKAKRDELSRVYNELWEDAENKFLEQYANDKAALAYYYEVTD